ncbi:MAG: DUF4340 domain-containing protein [Desulfobacteraceae bacterium]|nr:DUF4340 domain-containing protein [Desulfobacteraceae bacterium]
MNKKFIILLAVFGILLLAVFLKSMDSAKNKSGDLIFPSHKILSDTKEIEIISKDKKVILALEKNKWKVKNKFSFNADFEKISSLINNLESQDIIHTYDKSRNLLNDFHLVSPDENAVENTAAAINLKDENKNIVFKILFGKQREKGGTYLFIPETDKIYLSKKSVYIDSEAKNWVLNNLIEIKDEKIAGAAVYGADSKKILEVKNSQVIFPENIKNPDLEKIDEFLNFPENLDFYDIEKEKNKDTVEFKIEYILENNEKINIYVHDRQKRLISIETETKGEDSKIKFDNNYKNFIFSVQEYYFKRLIFSEKELRAEDKK